MAGPNFDPRAELEFVRQVIARVPQAVDRFIERMRCIPRFIGYRCIGRRWFRAPEIEDLSQEVTRIVLEKLPEFRAQSPLELWVRRICELEFHNMQRSRRKRERETNWNGEELEDVVPKSAIDGEKIRGAIARLGGYEAEIIDLRHFDGLGFDDISEIKAKPVAAIKSAYYRGIRRLGRILEDEMGSEEGVQT